MDILKRLRMNAEGLQAQITAAGFAGEETAVRVRAPDMLLTNLNDAAAEIERIRAELTRFIDERTYVVGFNDGWDFATVSAKVELAVAVEALKPFATYMQSGMDCDDKNKPLPDEHGVGWIYLTQGDFRRAHRAFSGLTESQAPAEPIATARPVR